MEMMSKMPWAAKSETAGRDRGSARSSKSLAVFSARMTSRSFITLAGEKSAILSRQPRSHHSNLVDLHLRRVRCQNRSISRAQVAGAPSDPPSLLHPYFWPGALMLTLISKGGSGKGLSAPIFSIAQA